MKSSYSAAAAEVLSAAQNAACVRGSAFCGTEHLLLALSAVRDREGAPCTAARLLASHGIAEQHVLSLLSAPQTETHSSAAPVYTPALARILRRAETEAQRFTVTADGAIGTEHLLFSLLSENDTVAAQILAARNQPLHELYGDVLSFLTAVSAEEAIMSGAGTEESDAPQMPGALHDMTADAADGKYTPLIGRESELDAVIRILCHRIKNNPCLIGEAGVGKTAIAEGLACRIVHGEVPPTLRDRPLYALDLGALLSGTRYRGDFEERLQAVLSFICDRAILFIDEVHLLMGAGAAEGGPDAANLLKPALSRASVQIIGATTPAEYQKSIARDGAMERRFQTVTVSEPTCAQTQAILHALVPHLEAHHGVRITNEAVADAAEKSIRALPHLHLPDKAIDLLDDACAAAAAERPQKNEPEPKSLRDRALLSGDLEQARLAAEAPAEPSPSAKDERPSVTSEDVALAIRRRTGITCDLGAEIALRLPSLPKILNAEVFGQEDAVSALCEGLYRSRGMHDGGADEDRPCASLLLAGPAGVGKAALGAALCRALLDGEESMLRFDMSEFSDARSLLRLTGVPGGDYRHKDELCAQIALRPCTFLLFDGIERAHPDVLRLLHRIIDTGFLTDGRGRSICFSHTVVVMTANTEHYPQKTTGFLQPGTSERPEDRLARFLPTEFLGSFDAVVSLRPLTPEAKRAILTREIEQLSGHLLARGIRLSVSNTLLDHLLAEIPDAHAARSVCAVRLSAPITRLLMDASEPIDAICADTDENGAVALSVTPSSDAPAANQ
ncbi:MAG: ATP-dependent Clp protease ATP-binding subunit [Clostridia bacterium]|nr:ATP-dependent Clp protease ATP-binding subunit [Clostridia bacterium]